MAFIKITDPKQREALAKELHDVKRRIQADSLQQRLEKQGLSRDLTKFFRPVVEAQEKTAAQIGKKIEDLPTMPPPLPALPPPEIADPLPIDQTSIHTTLGPRAQKYLQLSMTDKADHTFGLRSEDNDILIGSKLVTFDGDDIFVDGVRYKGTPGLWELLVKKRPETFEPSDLDNYAEILKASGAMYQSNDVLSRTPKSSGGYKWKNLVSHIYKQEKQGSGVRTVFLPSDFDQLMDRLDLCRASYEAGNNGVRNEIVAILDAMKKGRHISHQEYRQAHRNILK